MAFHGIEDVIRLSATIHNALVPGVDVVFLIEHPMSMAPGNPAWAVDGEGRRILPLDGCSRQGSARRIGSPRVSPNRIACWGRR
ncbi:hypothetical protein J2W42_003114 [Rhizobium tibeticum]|nr:hypothetical protein [Rhizobium tibeticum]